MSVLDGFQVSHIPSPGVGVPVIENPTGCIWSVYEGGFQRFDAARQKWIKYPVDESPLEPNSFFPIQENRILFRASDRLLEYRADTGQTQIVRQSSQTQLGRFNALCPSNSGGVWLAGDYGLAKVWIDDSDRGGFFWREYPLPADLYANGLTRIIEGGDGVVYGSAISNDSSRSILLQFDRKQWSIGFEDAGVDASWGWQAPNGDYWIVASPFTIYHGAFQSIAAVEGNKVLSRVLLNVGLDKNGSFWLATSEGLARYAPPTWQTPPPVAQLDRVMHAAYQDKQDRLWFLFTDRLVRCDGGQWRVISLPPGENSDELRANPFAAWNDEQFVIKTVKGAILYNPATDQFKPLIHPEGNQIAAVAAARDQLGVWIVSYSDSEIRLELFDGQSWKTILQQNDQTFLDPQIRDVYMDGERSLWLAGLNGLVRYKDGEYRRFTANDGYTDTAAYCIYPIDNRRLWVGGRESLFEFDGAAWKQIATGLDGVRSIQKASDGSLWVASGAGLHRLKNGSWVGNSYEDGLPNAAVFEVYQDRQGRIWAGTASGLSLYSPDADLDPPETEIPREKNSAEIGPAGASFFFAGMDRWKYTRSERLLYSWRIDAGAWSPFSSETAASVSELAPGRHRFEARTMDRNWNVDPTPAAFSFVARPPWYKEPGFLAILLLCVLLIAAIVGLIAWIVYSTQQRNRILARLVAERTADLTQANAQLQNDAREIKNAYGKVLSYQNQLQALSRELSRTEERERRRLAADLHDSIGQYLALAAIKLESLQDSLPPSDSRKDVERLQELIEQTLQSARSLTLELCPPILYEIGFEAAVEQLAEQIQSQYGVQAQISIECDCQAMSEDLRYVLFRSLRELLMNVAKHAKTPSVILRVRQEDGWATAEVRDFGVGFDPAKLPVKTGRFGLFSVGERLKQIGGRLIVKSAPGEGTCATIQVPI